MTLVFADLETYSETPIKDGAYVYAENAEILLFAYAFEDGEVQVWDCIQNPEMPEDLHEAINDPSVTFVFHNSMFDRTVLRYNGTNIPVERIEDTMVQAYAHSLPGSLAALCDIMGVDAEDVKDPRGKTLVRTFCVPNPKNQKIRRYTHETHPEEWEEFKEYAISDIRAMRSIYYKMPRWNYRDGELALWRLDQRINDRGFNVDRILAEKAVEAVAAEKKRLATDVVRATGGAVEAATQRDRLLEHICEAYGIKLPDLTKSTIERRINDPDLPKEVRELLALRQESSKASTSKYKALLKGLNADGRLRGTLQFCGATRTGRWSGRSFQPQNLYRPTLPQGVIDAGIRMIKEDIPNMYPYSTMELAANVIRGCISAPEGKKLIASDLSNIEGRFCAWIAGEDWKLRAFRDFDNGIGEDLYKVAYGKAFNVDPRSVGKGMKRQIGKTLELACIAEGQKVLTDRGLVKIENVQRHMKVWDGVDFVKHEGVVYRGMKEVITHDGLKATEDHIVVSREGREVPFGDCARKQIPLAETGYGGEAVRFVGGDRREDTTNKRVSGAKMYLSRMRGRTLCKLRQLCNKQDNKMPYVCEQGTSPCLVTSEMPSSEATLRESGRQGLRELRSEGYRVPFQIRHRDGGVYTGRARIAKRAGNRPNKQRRPLRTGQYKVVYTKRTVFQHEKNEDNHERLRMGENKISLQPIHDKKNAPTRVFQRGCNRQRMVGCLRETKELDGYTPKTERVRVYDIINAGPRHRFTVEGKLVHNCGYGGGVGAFLTMATAYRVDLEELAQVAYPSVPEDVWEEAVNFWNWSGENGFPTHGLDEFTFCVLDSLKRMWRRAHPQISSMWYELEDAFKAAIKTPGITFPVRKVKIRRDGIWVRILLPSGRYLCYPQCSLDDEDSIVYHGVSQYTRSWGRVHTWGGKLLENIVQAGSRDVMAHNMPEMEESGYEILLTVHDEVIAEVPNRPIFNEEEFSKILATVPPWAEGLPLSAGGFEGERYRKE